jgi:hypothetical protein
MKKDCIFVMFRTKVVSEGYYVMVSSEELIGNTRYRQGVV